jgi:hypothetical protein
MSPKQSTITKKILHNNNVTFKLKGPHIGMTWFQIWTQKNMTMRNKRWTTLSPTAQTTVHLLITHAHHIKQMFN